MAPKAGLSYSASPFQLGIDTGLPASPFTPAPPRASPAGGLSGLDSLAADSAADQLAVIDAFRTRRQAKLADLTAPPRRAPTPIIGVSAAGDELYVQGRRFTADDAQAALEAEATLSGAPVGQLPAGFQPLDPGTYAQYTQIIRNPSRGELAAKGFGRGIDSLQMLAGRGAQLLGAEEFGARTVKQQVEDLRKTEPYARQFTDIQSTDDAIDWFVATLGEQGPMLLESVAAGIAGAAAGGATGGPLAAVGGAVAGLVGKTAWKNSVLAAARKRAAGEVLDATQAKLLRNAAAISGATGANVANSMALGASDIYGELRDQGADADDVVARLTAVAGSLPYAALDLLPEFALASRLFGAGGRAAMAAGTSLPKRGVELLRRATTGTVAGGATEGATEMGQEAILLGLSDQDFSKPENIQRLINSFAAGAAIGGPLGGLANLKGRKAADVLQGGNPDQMLALPAPMLALPAPAVPSTLALPAPQGQLPDYSTSEMELPLAGGAGTAPLPTVGPAPTQGEMFPVAGLGEAPAAGTDQQMELPFAQGVAPSQTQDVLPLEAGLPPRFFAQPAAPTGTLADNPILRAMQERAAAAPVTAERQAEFEAAQQAVAAQQEAARVPTVELRRGQTLQQIQPELLAAETAIPSPELGTTPEQAAAVWDELAPGGRRKAFEKFSPAIQAQWTDALNMAQAGELTTDNLRAIRKELVTAENAARLTKTAPVTVVTGAITPTPTPPGGEGRALKKPEAAEVPPAEQPGASGEALKRPAAGRGTPGASTAQPETEAETKVEPVPPKPREAVQDVKAAAPAPAYASAEEAWDDMKPQGAPGLNEKTRNNRVLIPALYRAQWENIFRGGKASIERAKEVYDQFESELNPLVRVQQAIALMQEETRAVSVAFDEAADTLIEYAFFTTEETNTKPAVSAAREALVEADFAPKQWKAITDAFVEQANQQKKLSAIYEKGASKGKPHPWMSFAFENSLIQRLTSAITNTASLPQEIKDALGQSGKTTTVQPVQTKAPKPDLKLLAPDVSLSKLIRFLADYMKRGRLAANWDSSFVFEGETYSYGPRGFAEDMYAEINPTDAAAEFMGVPIREYFNVDGSLRLVESSRIVSGDTEFVTLKIGTAEDAKRGPATATVGTTLVKGKKGEQAPPNEVADTRAPTAAQVGKFKLSAFNKPDRPAPAVGKLRMAITRFTSRLATKPKMSVFRDQADMKAKNPKLYQQAIASRPEGDFATAVAAGFSFGDGNVVIFTDRIANEQHLNFVLAHETIGHFGLRGIIPAAQFNAVMDAVYNASPAIKADVDVAVANGMPRAEAVEEYLSDFAAVLDTSVVARVWNAIKGALNKLGIKFGDEMVRYTLKHARSYVRTGKPSIFDAAKVFGDLYDTEYGMGPVSTGRFSPVGGLADDMRNAEFLRDGLGSFPTSLADLGSSLRGMGVNSDNSLRKFVREVFSLGTYTSLENPGARQLEVLLNQGRDSIMRLRNKYDNMLAPLFAERGSIKYATSEKGKEPLNRVNDLIYAARLYALQKNNDARRFKGEPLVSIKDGVVVRNEPEIKRLTALGLVSLDQARKGFEYTVFNEDGTERYTEKFGGIPNLTEESFEWDAYNRLRQAINESEIALIEARYLAATSQSAAAIDMFNEFSTRGSGLSSGERAILQDISDIYMDLFRKDVDLDDAGRLQYSAEAANKAGDFVAAVNKVLLSGQDRDFTQLEEALKGSVSDTKITAVRNRLNDLRGNLSIDTEERKFAIQNKIVALAVVNESHSQAELSVRNTLAQGYVPVDQEGGYQITMAAVDAVTKRPMRLKQVSKDQLFYSRVEKESEANELAKVLNENLGDKSYEMFVEDPETGKPVLRTVRLVAKSGAVLDAVTGPLEANYNEFVSILNSLNIALAPEKREKVLVKLTQQNNAARKRLSYAVVRGAKKDALTSVSKFADSRASTTVKVMLRPALNDLIDLSNPKSYKLWFGDPELLETLKEQAKGLPTDDPRARDYVRYKNMYANTNPTDRAERGYEYYNWASRKVAFVDGGQNIIQSDFDRSPIPSSVRTLVTLMHLGASFATAALNLVAIPTNVIPYLASYNDKTGFGGGFGAGDATVAVMRALREVGLPRLAGMDASNAEVYDKIAASADLQKQYGLTANEAKFIAREIREGVMQPMQTNALMNTARGQAVGPAWFRKFTETLMLPFNTTESLSRRAAGLAAYRLEYNRQYEMLKTAYSEADAAKKADAAARQFAVETLHLTVGEYSSSNRPAMWRGGIASWLYMYKVFPTVMAQLLRNLSPGGRAGMIAALWLLSGLTGLPFAEDIEDIIDTLLQTLGFQNTSSRKIAGEVIDSVFPGMSPYVLRGAMNSFVGADIAGRTSAGNIIPGSGALLSGADIGRELTDIAGPIPSTLVDVAHTAVDILRAPFSARVSAVDVLRASPVTMVRALGDTVAYSQSDSLINRKGYLVSDAEVTLPLLATRMMGFSPAATAEEYSQTRIATRVRDYQRDVVTGFRTAWVSAKMQGDDDRAREIEEDVREWNKTAKGTAMEIGDFRNRSQRALKEAQRPTKERLLRTLPKESRGDIERTFDILSY